MHSQMATQITQLKPPFDDFDRLQAGSILEPDLMVFPVLDQWTPSQSKVPYGEGMVEGHPSLFDGKRIVTSDAFAHARIDSEHFVGTRSRWCRLVDCNLSKKHLGRLWADNTIGA